MDDRLSLPLPVAALHRRAGNAKSAKERHDTAYYAWEASLRLLVAAHPPADPTPLARASVGAWVEAARPGDRALSGDAVRRVNALFHEEGIGAPAGRKAVTPAKLLGGLAAYRNQVLGHGSARDTSFYRRAADTLLDGLLGAWSEHVFLPAAATVLFVEAVEIDPDGVRRARVLSLSGDAARVLDPGGTPGVPDAVLPRRVYLRIGDAYRSLHPWVVFREEGLREQVLFFNHVHRRVAYLDYVSGEALRGKDLDAALPALSDEVFELFRASASADGGRDGVGGGAGDGVDGAADDPDLFGDYRILGMLGQGGMGEVYLAEQQSLHRRVALKVLPAHAVGDAVAVERFRREVAALSRCDHPNLVKILSSGEAQGTPYYAMEYVEGADLRQVGAALSETGDFDAAVSTASERLRDSSPELFADAPPVKPVRVTPDEHGRSADERLAEAFRDAARGLHHLHEAGIVHRDVKPANLMVTAEERRIVVMDLGLAAVADATRTLTRDARQILGTLRYMPPEQLQRHLLAVDRRADVYSLGATFYELLTGRPIFDGQSEAQLIEQVLREDPLPPRKARPGLAEDLATILRKATEKDARLRYETSDALASDLDAYLAGRPIAARPPTLRYLLLLAVRRHRAVALTVASALLAVVALTAFYLLSFLYQRDEAIAAGRRAEERAIDAARAARRARAAGLAAASREVASEDPELAIYFAREAVGLDENPETVGALRYAIFVSPERARVELPPAPFGASLSLSPDGARLLVNDGAGATLMDADGRTLAELRGDVGAVVSAGFSPLGDRIVTAGSGGEVSTWDSDGRLLRTWRVAAAADVERPLTPPPRVAIAADGTRLVTLDDGVRARVWALDGRELGRVDDLPEAWTLGVAPAGRGFALATRAGRVMVFDDDGTRRSDFATTAGDVSQLAFLAGGERIALASQSAVGVWALDGTELFRVAAQPTEGPMPGALAMSPGGARAFLTRSSYAVWVLDLASQPPGELGAAIPPGLAASPLLYRIAVAESGALVSALHDGRARAWDAAGSPLPPLRAAGDAVDAVAISADGERAATLARRQIDGTRVLQTWDLAPRELARMPAGGGTSVLAYAPDGETLAAAAPGGVVRLWSADGDLRAELVGHRGAVTDLAHAGDRQLLVTGSVDGTARVWDASGAERARFPPPTDEAPGGGQLFPGSAAPAFPVTRVALTDDARWAAAADDTGRVRVWDVAAGTRRASISARAGGVAELAFSPDGALLLTLDEAGEALLWTLDGARAAELSRPGEAVASAAFAPDGRVVALGLRRALPGASGAQPSEKRPVARIVGLDGTERAVLSSWRGWGAHVRFSPAGRHVLTLSDTQAEIWTLDGARVTGLLGHAENISDAAFSPDGERIVTGGPESVRLWNLAGDSLAVLRTPGTRVAFSPKGDRFASATWRDVRLWLRFTDDLVQLADTRCHRILSSSEMVQYAPLLGTEGTTLFGSGRAHR